MRVTIIAASASPPSASAASPKGSETMSAIRDLAAAALAHQERIEEEQRQESRRREEERERERLAQLATWTVERLAEIIPGAIGTPNPDGTATVDDLRFTMIHYRDGWLLAVETPCMYEHCDQLAWTPVRSLAGLGGTLTYPNHRAVCNHH